MSQNASANPFVLEPLASPSGESAASPPEPYAVEPVNSPVELRADEVMDDIFGDVERLLHDRATLSLEASASEPHFSEPTLSPLLALPGLGLSTLAVPQAAVAGGSEEIALAALHSSTSNALARATSERSTPGGKAFDRLLLAIAFAALVGTGAVWFLLQTRLRQATTVVPDAPVATATQVVPADQKFLDYLTRSLTVIDRKAEIKRENGAVASAVNGELPRVAVAGSQTRPGSSSTVLERVYIPVYQPPQAFNVPSLSVSPATAPATIPVQPAAPPSQTATAALPQNIAPVQHVLVGVLELGDRSAALFEINGTPRRVQIGEAIGTSGWTLAGVRNQEAIVRRNGEVRSIYVGQRF